MTSIVHWGKYFPPDRGGIESVTFDLCVGASSAGYDVQVVCFGRISKTRTEIANAVAQVIRTPIQFVKLSQPLGFAYFYWAVKLGRKADIIHIHAPNMMAALAALCIGRKPRVVVHWHSDVVSKGIIGWVMKPLEKALLWRADAIVATSLAYAQASTNLQSRLNKLAVVPIGIPDVQSKMNSDQIPVHILEWAEGKKIVLSVGRLVAYKGFDVLIDAANSLSKESVVIIVGEGPLMAVLRAQVVKNKLENRVLLAGSLSNVELAALFRHAVLFCLASTQRSEAFGVVLLEAMAHGLPIVATNIPGSGVPWVNQEGVSGLNVSVNNSQELAEACNRIVSDENLREQFALCARTRYKNFFTLATATSKILSVYDHLLKSNTV